MLVQWWQIYKQSKIYEYKTVNSSQANVKSIYSIKKTRLKQLRVEIQDPYSKNQLGDNKIKIYYFNILFRFVRQDP